MVTLPTTQVFLEGGYRIGALMASPVLMRRPDYGFRETLRIEDVSSYRHMIEYRRPRGALLVGQVPVGLTAVSEQGNCHTFIAQIGALLLRLTGQAKRQDSRPSPLP